jgi:hypothetical protein
MNGEAFLLSELVADEDLCDDQAGEQEARYFRAPFPLLALWKADPLLQGGPSQTVRSTGNRPSP